MNKPHANSSVTLYRHQKKLPTPIRGYLDASGANDDELCAIIADDFYNEVTDEETAEKLHNLGYVTSRMFKRVITNSNVSKFRGKYLGLKKHGEHIKPNYKHQNHIIHNNLKYSGIQKATQNMKYEASPGTKRDAVMVIQNRLGRDKPI